MKDETENGHGNGNGRRRALLFDPKIDAGNILTALSMLGTILIACAVFFARDAVKEQRLSTLETGMVKMSAAMEGINANQIKMGIILEGMQREQDKRRP